MSRKRQMISSAGNWGDVGMTKSTPEPDFVLRDGFSGERVMLVRGRGVFVEDAKGKRYLDAIGGVGVVNVGHAVPEIVDAIATQAGSLAFSYGHKVDNLPRCRLAELIQHWAPPGMGHTRTLFSSGGAEANEAALKLAVQYHREKGHPGKTHFISRWQSYHGNTLGALSVSGRTQWRQDFESLLCRVTHIQPPYCYRCPYGQNYPGCGLACAEELERVIRQIGPHNIAAFIAEPIIGTSMSAVVPPPEYYPRIREICDRYDVLLIVDEVMSGFGRTGHRFGIDHWDVTPDIITVAKGISGGYAPLAATILRDGIWRAFESGSGKVQHSYTYGGNPLSCAAGVAVLRYLEEHSLAERAGAIGAELVRAIRDATADLPWVGDVRGLGLFLGIELVADSSTREPFPVALDIAHRVVDEAFDRGMLILGGVTGNVDGVAGDHVELLPPYTIADDHCEFIAATLKESIEAACRD